MSSCRETCHSRGTFCCAKYVCCTAVSHCCIFVVLLVMLIALQGYEMWMAHSLGEEILDMAVLLRFWELKASLLIGCIVTLIISIVGFKLSKSKNRRTGLFLVAMLLAALSFQVYAFAHLLVSEQNLEQLDDWLGGGKINPDDWEEFTRSSRAKTMTNFYLTFVHAMDEWDCSVTDGNSASKYLGFNEEQHFAPIRKLDPLTRCGNEKTVTCDRSEHFAQVVSGFCGPLVDTTECGNCLQNFLTDFNILEGLSDEDKDELEQGHAGGRGTMFCRCLPATMSWFEGNAQIVLVASLAYIAVESLVVLSILWLFMCGPDETAAGRKATPELEMEEDLEVPGEGDQIVQVVCPFDSGPGELVMVRFEDRQCQVQVPAGVFPGQTFYARV